MNKTNWIKEEEDNIELFSGLLEEYGQDPKSLNWGSEEKQFLRFKVLKEIGLSEGDSVLDVGCGLGDFYGWLTNNNIQTNFTGVDITSNMIEHAKTVYPNAKFECENVLEKKDDDAWKHDYVFASGIFSKRPKSGMEFMEHAIDAMFSLAVKGVAFNSLSGWADTKEETEFHPDPLQTIEFCRKLTRKVVLRHDYHPGDFTIYMYREYNE